jgi:hypothetical protein
MALPKFCLFCVPLVALIGVFIGLLNNQGGRDFLTKQECILRIHLIRTPLRERMLFISFYGPSY